MKPKIPIILPKKLEKLLKIINSRDDARNIISSCHLYLEGLFEKILQEKIGSKKTRQIVGEHSNLLEKAKILYSIDFFDENDFYDICIISNLRNKFSHQLNPDKKKIQNLYNSIRNTQLYDFRNKKRRLNKTSDKVLFLTIELHAKYEKMLRI